MLLGKSQWVQPPAHARPAGLLAVRPLRTKSPSPPTCPRITQLLLQLRLRRLRRGQQLGQLRCPRTVVHLHQLLLLLGCLQGTKCRRRREGAGEGEAAHER